MTCTELLINFLKTLGYDEKDEGDYVEIPYEDLIGGLRAFEKEGGEK